MIINKNVRLLCQSSRTTSPTGMRRRLTHIRRHLMLTRRRLMNTVS